MNKKFLLDETAPDSLVVSQGDGTLIGCRIPRDYFITTGAGESDITVHAGSYHLALREAGIEMCNIMTYSSIMPAIATEVPYSGNLTHGSVMETIMAASTAEQGAQATAGIIYGWLRDRESGARYGGLVCEYNGPKDEEDAGLELHASLNELYTHGYDDRFEMDEIRLLTRSMVPMKRYGTVIVAICFINHVIPVMGGAG